MPRQLWIADAARESGLPVTLVDGWAARGGVDFRPEVVVAHHTANPGRGDYPSLSLVRDGREGLPGPLSQLGLGRSGTVYVIAAGRANHAGPGSWRGVSGNTKAIGIEAESAGTRDDWTAAQRDAYPRLVAALLRRMGRDAGWLCGHKEWAPSRKIDPAYWNMDQFRTEVAALLANPGSIAPVPTPNPTKEDEMTIIHCDGEPTTVVTVPGVGPRSVDVWGIDVDGLARAGVPRVTVSKALFARIIRGHDIYSTK